MHRSGGQLFLLVTDQGFLEKSSLVWETLANIEGDTEFVDAQFQPGGEEGLAQGEEGDRALALALGRQEEQGREREQVNFFFFVKTLQIPPLFVFMLPLSGMGGLQRSIGRE